MFNLKIYSKSILTPVILGSIISFFISSSIDYNTLQRPILSPPSVVFPIVWTVLYILMGFSYGFLKTNNLNDSKSDSIYYFQLIVNLLWPIIFFVFKMRLFAFFWIIFLIILVINMIIKLYNKNIWSGLIQIPYLIWLLFATYLNLAIDLLNK